jgi:hypothetical protein
LIWILGAVAAWMLSNPGDALVGARPGGGGSTPVYDLAPSDLREATELLSKSALWGIKRDGTVLPPASKSKEAEEKKIQWRILASVSKKQERYVVIQIDKEKPEALKEGEQLPDGSKLLKISPSKLTVMTADDEQKTINLNL